MRITLLDGPMGTELCRRGLPTPAPEWSAAALRDHQDLVAEVHRAYTAAGATVHTANTFRTQPRPCPHDWRQLLARAVGVARRCAPATHQVAGSMAPLMDCYSPWLSPPDARPEHRLVARALAEEGVDLVLVETFPHVGEALVAVEEAVATGLPVWVSFTPGPDGDLLSPAEVARGARSAAERGASALLVNCLPATRALEWLRPLLDLGLGLPVGVYANAGHPTEGLGWEADPAQAGERYADLAEAWVASGARIVGSCCGTGPETIAALSRRFRTAAP
ncbi:homocysteine S-methyltransferase family protein [Myxococcota bacterium]|nr:homocysteine S-methyltransferase family protein [Myxococcota bacterium]